MRAISRFSRFRRRRARFSHGDDTVVVVVELLELLPVAGWSAAYLRSPRLPISFDADDMALLCLMSFSRE